MSQLKIRALTLNFWNIPLPIVCKDQGKRLAALCDFLLSEKYDIVALQEMWFGNGHNTIIEKCGAVYSHTHYFARGFMGAGLLVLSKYPITDTLFMSYAPNGLPVKIHQADFYGGKGVGLCRIDADGHFLDVYTTHIHASYSEDNSNPSAYRAHRTAQLLQLSQYVRNTRRAGASMLLMGDLNTTPAEECMGLLVGGGQLHDSWLDANGSEDGGETSNTPDNHYSAGSGSPQRIDWLLYGGSAIKCLDCQVVARRIPDSQLCYSDHNGVTATFELSQTGSPASVQVPISAEHLSSASDTLRHGVHEANQRLSFCGRLLVACLIILTILLLLPSCWPVSLVFGCTVAFSAFQFFAYTINMAEVRELRMLLCSIKLLLDQTGRETGR